MSRCGKEKVIKFQAETPSVIQTKLHSDHTFWSELCNQPFCIQLENRIAQKRIQITI